MKIGIITDIHSNINALNAVLNEFEKMKVEKIICGGDIIGIGPYPEETVQALIKLKDKLIAVKGNHEEYFLSGLSNNENIKTKMSIEEIENHKWTHSKLSNISENFLKTLPIANKIKIKNKEIYIVHYPIYETKKATIEQNEKMFSNIAAEIFIYGHTHIKSINNKNGKWYINPGSLGCPVKSNIANTGILEINNNEIHYEQLKVEYNKNETIQEIEKLKFPNYKEILKIFYGK